MLKTISNIFCCLFKIPDVCQLTVKECLCLLRGGDGQGLEVGRLHVCYQLLDLPLPREDRVFHVSNLKIAADCEHWSFSQSFIDLSRSIFMLCTFEIWLNCNLDRDCALLSLTEENRTNHFIFISVVFLTLYDTTCTLNSSL